MIWKKHNKGTEIDSNKIMVWIRHPTFIIGNNIHDARIPLKETYAHNIDTNSLNEIFMINYGLYKYQLIEFNRLIDLIRCS